MKTIWKWELTPEGFIEMPKGSKVLCVQEQQGLPQLWALVDPSAEMETRQFSTYGTGHLVEKDSGVYIGTFQLDSMVFHVFEEGVDVN